jgi:hypothetical protein
VIHLKAAITESLLREQYEKFASLAFAAKEGDVEVVRGLLRLGAEIDAVDYDGRTALAMVSSTEVTLSIFYQLMV